MKKNKVLRIEATSPTRVDLAGGTLDLWPLYLFHQDCLTVNLAIDIKTYVTLTTRRDDKIILRSQDTKQELTYERLDDISLELNTKGHHDLMLLKVHADFWKPRGGFELETRSESPVGAGIAASSSLNISLCGAFSSLTERTLSDSEIVTLAGNLEARVIQTPTGCQDYFPALYGGLNIINLTELGPRRRSLEFNLAEFQKHFLLVYTGRPHQSGLNNWQIFKNHIEGEKATYSSFEDLKGVAQKVADACTKQDWGQFGALFDQEFKARLSLSKVFSSPEIERLRTLGLDSGAEALKICGAGGGGCAFLWCPPDKKNDLEKKCRQAGFQVLTAQPTRAGLETKVNSL